MAPLEPQDVGLGLLFWTIQEALVVADPRSDRIALWNPAAEALFDWSAEQAVGRPTTIFLPEGLAGLRPGACAGRRDGAPLTIELTVSPLRADDAEYVLAVIRDVSAREATEAALRASE